MIDIQKDITQYRISIYTDYIKYVITCYRLLKEINNNELKLVIKDCQLNFIDFNKTYKTINMNFSDLLKYLNKRIYQEDYLELEYFIFDKYI